MHKILFRVIKYSLTLCEISKIVSLEMIKVKNETAVGLHVYRKGPPLGLGWVMQGWGGSCRDGVDHTGVV